MDYFILEATIFLFGEMFFGYFIDDSFRLFSLFSLPLCYLDVRPPRLVL